MIDAIAQSPTCCDKLPYLFPPSYSSENMTRSDVGYFELILNGTTKEEFLARLNQLGDLEIIYELKTPIITPIEPIEFNISQGATININSDIAPTSTHEVILNRAGQIEQDIELIANLKSRVNDLEYIYDSNLIAIQYRLNNLKLNYELEREED